MLVRKKEMILFKEINKNFNKILFINDRKYLFSEIIEEINKKSKFLKKFKNQSAILENSNKKEFLINFYACNKNNIKTFITDKISLKKAKSLELKFNLLIKKKVYRISFKKNFSNKKISLILNTSGSTNSAKFVYLSERNISYITNQMNLAMKIKKDNHELLFAPLDHAFGLGRMHSVLKSASNLTLVDQINLSELFRLYKKNFCNSLSMPAKILEKIMIHNKKLFLKNFSNCKYIQISSGLFPVNLRKKLLQKKINMFINYGTTEVMRTTFLDVKKYPNKINTEGKPFKNILIKTYNPKSNKGELLVKGPNVAIGYSNKKAWMNKFKDGWYHTGDVVKIDKKKFITYIGRTDDSINLNDINYSISYVEKYLLKTLKVNNLKIIFSNKKKQLFLFLGEKIEVKKIYKELKKDGLNFNFNNIFFNMKFNFHKNGKLKINHFKKIIEKRIINEKQKKIQK